jgi:aromatic ring-opening dioxygenase catalytic subunit (LigB family)
MAISAAAAGTPLYYDFGGFHPRYYTLEYRTSDASDIAQQVSGVLAGTTPLHQFMSRGLDHGAFIPLMAMLPAADVPVIQLSMPSLDPEALLNLGRRLTPTTPRPRPRRSKASHSAIRSGRCRSRETRGVPGRVSGTFPETSRV